MSPKEFFDLVSSMRKAQREYFAVRSGDALERSKRLEKEVDREIERVISITRGGGVQKQLEL